MAVAHDAVSESHTGTAGVASVSSFTWDHVPVGTPRSALVFVHCVGVVAISSVTYGGTTMVAVPYTAYDSDTEPGAVKAYFLDNVGSGTKAVVVTRENTAVVTYAVCMTQTASAACAIHTAGVKTRAGSGAEQTAASSSETGTASSWSTMALTDGMSGTNSVRYIAVHSGASSVPAAGANTTSLGTSGSIDYGNYVFFTMRDTTPATGSVTLTIGTAISDDLAVVGLAVIEPTVTSKGPYTDAGVGVDTAGVAQEKVCTEVGVATDALASLGKGVSDVGVGADSAALAAAFVLAGATYAAEVLADSPIVYYRMGSDDSGTHGVDRSPNGHDGVYVGSPTLAHAGLLTGDSDTAVDWTRSSGQRLWNESGMPAGVYEGITIEMLAMWDVVPTADANYVCFAWGPVGLQGHAWLSYRWFSTGVGWWDYIYTDGTTQGINPYFPQGQEWVPEVGHIYHLALTHDYPGKVVRFFVDGVELTRSGSSADPASYGVAESVPVGTPLMFGSYYTNYGWDDVLDEGAVYNSVLSSARVEVHSARAHVGPAASECGVGVETAVLGAGVPKGGSDVGSGVEVAFAVDVALATVVQASVGVDAFGSLDKGVSELGVGADIGVLAAAFTLVGDVGVAIDSAAVAQGYVVVESAVGVDAFGSLDKAVVESTVGVDAFGSLEKSVVESAVGVDVASVVGGDSFSVVESAVGADVVEGIGKTVVEALVGVDALGSVEKAVVESAVGADVVVAKGLLVSDAGVGFSPAADVVGDIAKGAVDVGVGRDVVGGREFGARDVGACVLEDGWLGQRLWVRDRGSSRGAYTHVLNEDAPVVHWRLDESLVSVDGTAWAELSESTDVQTAARQGVVPVGYLLFPGPAASPELEYRHPEPYFGTEPGRWRGRVVVAADPVASMKVGLVERANVDHSGVESSVVGAFTGGGGVVDAPGVLGDGSSLAIEAWADISDHLTSDGLGMVFSASSVVSEWNPSVGAFYLAVLRGKWAMYVKFGFGNSAGDVYEGSYEISDAAEYFALSKSGAVLTGIVDGAAVGSLSCTGVFDPGWVSSGLADVYFGVRDRTLMNPLQGVVSHPGVYPHPLSVARAFEHYKTGSAAVGFGEVSSVVRGAIGSDEGVGLDARHGEIRRGAPAFDEGLGLDVARVFAVGGYGTAAMTVVKKGSAEIVVSGASCEIVVVLGASCVVEVLPGGS